MLEGFAMIFKSMKWGAYAAGGALLLGGLVFGMDSFSYLRSSAKSVRSAVKDGVPLEFELQRARDLVEDILPELRANVRVIAQEEVEIAHLRREITSANQKMESQRQSVSAFRNKLRGEEVKFVVHGRQVSREQMTEQLASNFDRYKQAEATLVSKQRLLEAREKSLAAAQNVLERSRARKAELEQKIEALSAQYRLVQAQSVGTKVSIDDTQLARADKLIADIHKRLDTAQRVLAHEADLSDVEDTFIALGISESELLAEVDHALDDPSPAIETQMVSGQRIACGKDADCESLE
jgi:chromosome segregation ATPase